MDTTTYATIVLVLLWLYLCCQALGFLLTLVDVVNATTLPTTTILSTALLGICLWLCKKAGYLVSPMNWYHWVLLVLLVLLQVLAVVIEYLGLQGMFSSSIGAEWTHPIYAVAVVLLGILGGTLYCGWKCNLFCRPCCKSQYICYGSTIVVVLVILILLAVTGALAPLIGDGRTYYDSRNGETEARTVGYLGKMVLPFTQFYVTAVLWNTTLKLPYAVPEVVAVVAAALSSATILVLAVPGVSHGLLPSTVAYPLLSIHLATLVITWYFMEYKAIFSCPKQYLCFGILTVVLLVALVVVGNAYASEQMSDTNDVQYTLLGYSMVLIVPTLWYAYRCGLFIWCLPKKKNLRATDTAENTTADTDIAKES
ncbi:putative integral membrane protein [Babesia bovis T2Bo]|uniref:Membrane protein, putative n=1 Tax=Babesia bovis TaxID=5865 RepID=A7AML8_BABBO|nr:putative integral membrane protein [Babesia bovis T2Bo]EDO07802.1 putative integral membrane protein [Babesia bovis T2Bo]|eukprot:XP_001611370.1 membrane protein [Babesia bovis T2Bo]